MTLMWDNTLVELRPPRSTDGEAVHRLVQSCPPLDTNSTYCNLLQCSHFADTSVAAVYQGEMVGFISGYRVPEHPNTLFVWQVAVGERARGQGLATRMLRSLLKRCDDIAYVETSITADNQASWALFRGMAEKMSVSLEESVLFDRQQHFANQHQTEYLARLGPFSGGVRRDVSKPSVSRIPANRAS